MSKSRIVFQHDRVADAHIARRIGPEPEARGTMLARIDKSELGAWVVYKLWRDTYVPSHPLGSYASLSKAKEIILEHFGLPEAEA